MGHKMSVHNENKASGALNYGAKWYLGDDADIAFDKPKYLRSIGPSQYVDSDGTTRNKREIEVVAEQGT